MEKSKYYLNTRPLLNGDFSVHKEGCPFIADYEHRINLGKFSTCHDALRMARVICQISEACYFCNKNYYQINSKKKALDSAMAWPICHFSEN